MRKNIINHFIFPSALQYSCTILQYSFHKSLEPHFRHFADKLKIKINKATADYKDFSAEFEKDCGGEKFRVNFDDSGGRFSTSSDNEAEGLYRLLCAAKDVGADVNMDLTFTGSLAGDALGNYITNERSTDWLFIYATDKCSLLCPYCYKDKSSDKEMQLKDIRDFAIKIRKKVNDKNKEEKTKNFSQYGRKNSE